MAEQESGAPAPEPENTSFDDKLAAKLGLSEPAPEPDAPKEAEEAAPSDELAADEVADEIPSSGEFEITHNGAKIKVSKEEAKNLAEQGYDYTRKASALAEERKTLEAQKAALQEKARITPEVINAIANVRVHEQALQQYKDFDWGKHAQDDPIGYIATRARYDQLREGLQQAQGAANQASQAATQVQQQLTAAELSQQLNKVMEGAPDLRDPQKYTAEATKIRSYLTKMGLTEQETNNLYDARMLLIARDAMRYRQAIEARSAQKEKTTPTLTPGAAPHRPSAALKEAETVKQLHQAKDPARKKELIDRVLAAKLARMA